MKTALSVNQVIVAAALFMSALTNVAFFRNVLNTLGEQPWGYAHAGSLGLVLFCALVIVLSLLCFRPTVKVVLAMLFMISAFAAYFMDSYNVVIDKEMIANAVATDPVESADLISARMVLYVVLLGVLPSVVVSRLAIRTEAFNMALRARLLLIFAAIAVAVSLVLGSSGFYASFVREHKVLRYYTNPLTPVYGAYRYAIRTVAVENGPLQVVGEDARLPSADVDRELVVLVVGETARADRFSLNGYQRETNPVLKREDVVSFTRVSSCGTSTLVSVPCMFAIYDRDHYSDRNARSTENLLDVLQHARVNVLWRDNNSNSKGVADRVAFEDFKSPDVNPLCDPECRDEGMLAGLQDYVDSHPRGDILIVLHQMGSHGPAYHKRYPEAFRRFQPTCETSQLDDCTQEEISNTYDNTILYTDDFLGKVIEFLRSNDGHFETAMLYASDHGESLGEGGLYLHGLPYFIAPDAQVRVPVIFWLGRHFDGASVAAVDRLRDASLTHDNIFHTVLGIFEIESAVYDPGMDILNRARMASGEPAEFR